MSLFVGNLSRNINAVDLEKEFDKFGTCRINYKGSFAFAEYEREKDAEDALENLQNKDMGGKKINIEWSKKSKKYDVSRRRRSRSRSRRCYNCGSKGHYLRDCR